MYALLAGLLIAFPLSTPAGAHNFTSRARDEATSGSAAKTYVLQDLYQNEDFFRHVYFCLVLRHPRSDPL